jgi:endonuclease YncB( thermonuclease family)
MILAASAGPAAANWIVFARGGMQEIKGVIEVRGRQVVFHSPGGTLLSARLEDVDVPSSAFLTWQVSDGRALPAGPPARFVVPGQGAPVNSPPPPCHDAVVDSVVNAETLKIKVGGRLEGVHLACVDGPDTRHKFPDLDWYGRVAQAAVEGMAPAGSTVCVSEDTPPRRDVEGHRLVYLRTRSGADLGAAVIARGLGVVRTEPCARLESYRVAERQARLAGEGHWGEAANGPSLAIAINAMALTGGPGPAPLAGVRGPSGGT